MLNKKCFMHMQNAYFFRSEYLNMALLESKTDTMLIKKAIYHGELIDPDKNDFPTIWCPFNLQVRVYNKSP